MEGEKTDLSTKESWETNEKEEKTVRRAVFIMTDWRKERAGSEKTKRRR